MLVLSTIACQHPPPPMPLPAPAPLARGFHNVDACSRYVTTMNALPCMPLTLVPAEICPSSLDLTPCDMGPYYDCMATNSRCNGEFLDVSGQANCAPPACP